MKDIEKKLRDKIAVLIEEIRTETGNPFSTTEEIISAFSKSEWVDVASAIKVLATELQKNHRYYMGWQANIAMAFKDEYRKQEEKNGNYIDECIDDIANTAANNFLALLTKFSTPAEPKKLSELHLDKETCRAILDCFPNHHGKMERDDRMHTTIFQPYKSYVLIINDDGSMLCGDQEGAQYFPTLAISKLLLERGYRI